MNLRSWCQAVLGVGTGAIAWTATEYASHRWVLHGPFGRGRLARVPLGGLHRAHHGEPLATVLAARLAGHSAILGAGVGAATVIALVTPRPFARAVAVAWVGGYATYEISHWNAHHRLPRTKWGLRLRRRHFRHHFGAPRANLGITMSWWDDLFGTETDSGVAAIPPHHVPAWLVDEHGVVRPELRGDFVLVDG